MLLKRQRSGLLDEKFLSLDQTKDCVERKSYRVSMSGDDDDSSLAGLLASY